ncbi:DUF3310 domain-containing protein [Schleiferilactobacillus shenzhenensis]|uniref:DUF3310 domain-containing protein n=1 Tax=Schleiferilactobacillus shenzhenensis LY-73 TaxID=1231336 RepID=U4TKX1_9LACO|nr:DUF3310 domain-containing protein [Schleiferilactobacillus shenzhenensis]ERL64035.1 hypothetical protein L248_1682 [Schleiferilactobacillus shenzhenensis LY-73]
MTDKNIRPDYYRHGTVDVIAVLYLLFGDTARVFLVGNIIKYIVRYRDKNGMEDLIKARTYLDRLIEEEGKQK